MSASKRTCLRIQLLAIAGLALAIGSPVFSQVSAQRWLCDQSRKTKACTEKTLQYLGTEYLEFEENGIKKHKYIGNEVDTCLAEMLACNENSEVASRLTRVMNSGDGDGLPRALPSNQQYSLGLAFYRMHIETRSEILRCAYANRSKIQIRSFLIDVKEHSDPTKGNARPLDFGRIKTALNILQILNEPSNCPDQPLTVNEIMAIAKEFASREIEKLITEAKASEIPSGNNPVVDLISSFYGGLKRIMSTIASIESMINLLEVDLTVNKESLARITKNQLEKLYCEPEEISSRVCEQKVAFRENTILVPGDASSPLLQKAKASINDSIGVNNLSFSIKNGTQQLAGVEDAIGSMLGSAYACIGDANPQACFRAATLDEAKNSSVDEAYRNLRGILASTSYHWAAQSVRQDAMLRSLFNGSGNTSFVGLMNQLNRDEVADNPVVVARDIASMMQEKRGSEACFEQPEDLWYCCSKFSHYPYCQ